MFVSFLCIRPESKGLDLGLSWLMTDSFNEFEGHGVEGVGI